MPSHVLDDLPDGTRIDNPSLGIRLVLSINSSSLEKGEKIGIIITVQNLLSRDNKLNSAKNWKVANLEVHPCGELASLHPPIRYAIFQGYHTENDLAHAHRLNLWSPGPYFCPSLPSGPNFPEWFVFEPNNDIAGFYSYNSDSCFTHAVSIGWAFGGSWKDGSWRSGFLTGAFHPFSSGVYTVVGGDEWGTC